MRPLKLDEGIFQAIEYITPENAVFARTEGGFASMTYNGTLYARIAVYRSFPHSMPTQFLSVRDTDAKELGVIRDIDEFDSQTVSILEEQMMLRYYCPLITKVIKIKEEYGYVYWEAETDAGRVRFTCKSEHGALIMLGEDRLLIVDIDGNRFEIPDMKKLSPKDMRELEMVI